MIKHEPQFDTDKICKIYSEKDGVPIKYVCTSALGDEAQAMDIFYRDTPHPKFGNKYFEDDDGNLQKTKTILTIQ
jgi:hypothetical protein